jgi:hypothetical protein
MEVAGHKTPTLAPTLGQSSWSSDEFEGPINNANAVSCKSCPLFCICWVPVLLDAASQNPTWSRMLLIKFDTVTRSRKTNWIRENLKLQPCSVLLTWSANIKNSFPVLESKLCAAVHQNPEGSLKTEFESQEEASSGSYSIHNQHQYSRAKPNWLVEAWFWSTLLLAHQGLPQNFKIFDLAHTSNIHNFLLHQHEYDYFDYSSRLVNLTRAATTSSTSSRIHLD